jgi:hypothetical protein
METGLSYAHWGAGHGGGEGATWPTLGAQRGGGLTPRGPPITQAAQAFGRWGEAALQATKKTRLNGSGCQKVPPYKLAACMREARALASREPEGVFSSRGVRVEGKLD